MGHIWMTGMMGAGKSTVGRLVAQRLGRPFYDTDELIERARDASITEIFAEDGEPGFRKREKQIIEEVASRPWGVVATGGGVVLDSENVATMQRSGTIVYLSVDVETLSRRLERSEGRPLLEASKDERLHTIAAEREERYRTTADVIVDAAKSVDVVVVDVEVACRES